MTKTPIAVASERGLWVWIPEPDSSSMQLPELIDDLRRNRWRLLGAVLVGGISTLLLTFLLPVRYQSIAVLAPAQTEPRSTLEGLSGRFGDFAGLAGVSLPVQSHDKRTLAVATLGSRAFLLDFSKRYSVDRQLFDSRFDSAARKWRPKLLFWGGQPSDDELIERLEGSIYIEQDALTGLIMLKVLAETPSQAHQWGEALVNDLNELMRTRDIEEAERAIAYLEQRVTSTDVAELRQVFYRLIEDRMKAVMLARVSPEYALRVVDPASTPDRPTEPRRWLLAALGAVLATLAVLGWIFARFALRPLVSEKLPVR